MPVSLHTAADHLAVEHVEGSEQRGSAVPLIIVGHSYTAPRLDRQARLSAVERLDLALFVDAEHHRVRRRVDIQPDDVTQLGDEFRVTRQFELPYPMRLEAVRAPDTLYRGDADLRQLGHRRRRPMGGLARRVGLGQSDDALADGGRERCNARRSGLVAQEAIHAFMHERFLPAPQAGLAFALANLVIAKKALRALAPACTHPADSH